MKYEDVQAIAKAYDDKLLATDDRFRNVVEVHHSDGSYFKWRHAFAMQVDDFIIVFTEHFKFHIFHEQDLVAYTYYKVKSKINEQLAIEILS